MSSKTAHEESGAADRPGRCLREHVAAGSLITGLEEKNASLKINGSASSAVAISTFMANLRKSGKFKDVDVIVTRQDLARPTPLVTFEVTCRFEG